MSEEEAKAAGSAAEGSEEGSAAEDASQQEEEEKEEVIEGPQPDPVLKKLYQSHRPPVELTEGVGLAPVVCACWPKADSEAMLKESWLPGRDYSQIDATGEGNDKPPPASFDPTALNYSEMPKRISRSQPMVQWNDLKLNMKRLELEIAGIKDADEKEEKQSELEKMEEEFAAAEAALGELKASFEPDPLALVPWMSTLFELADAGLTSFDASGRFFPHCDLNKALGAGYNTGLYDGVERLLGAFARRYAAERGPGRVQIFTKLVPNFFKKGYDPAVVVPQAVQGILSRVGLPAVDMVQLVWWDFDEKDVLPTLKELSKLATDKTSMDEEGRVHVTEAAKVRALGVVDFPARIIKDAVQAGINVTAVQVSFNVLQGAWDILDVCKEYGIKVLARDCLLGGLMDEKYLTSPQPCSIAGDDDVDGIGLANDIVKHAGGWARLQEALRVVRGIALMRGVSMQAVALRYVMDHGAFASATMRWPPHPWSQFGYLVPKERGKPGIDAPLFHRDSFLTQQDMEALAALCTA